jgi:hypothetical protein
MPMDFAMENPVFPPHRPSWSSPNPPYTPDHQLRLHPDLLRHLPLRLLVTHFPLLLVRQHHDRHNILHTRFREGPHTFEK